MKKLFILLLVIMLITLSSCGKNIVSPTQPIIDEPSVTIPFTDTIPITTEPKGDDSYMNKTIELTIGNTKVNFYWLDNDSLKALKELVKDGLTINMSVYGDFEQVCSLGKTITSSDESLTTLAGDICLYQSIK